MNFILGMDIWVFIGWLGTILATILCILYGLYHEFLKKNKKKVKSLKKSTSKKEG